MKLTKEFDEFWPPVVSNYCCAVFLFIVQELGNDIHGEVTVGFAEILEFAYPVKGQIFASTDSTSALSIATEILRRPTDGREH